MTTEPRTIPRTIPHMTWQHFAYFADLFAMCGGKVTIKQLITAFDNDFDRFSCDNFHLEYKKRRELYK